jgi:hypothetical protein
MVLNPVILWLLEIKLRNMVNKLLISQAMPVSCQDEAFVHLEKSFLHQ